MGAYSLDTTGLTKAQVDTKRKASIVELLGNAAGSGAEAIPNVGKISGALTMSDIRAALGVITPEAERLVNSLVDAGTIVRVTGGSELASAWRYTTA